MPNSQRGAGGQPCFLCVTSEAYTQCPSYLLERIIPSADCPCIWIYIIPNIFLKAIYMSEPLKASHLINCAPGEKLCRPR